MSLFEVGMLICFGAAWPFSIAKTLMSRQVSGKSLSFLLIVLLGYILGILHKIFYNFDAVIYLYALNSLMVTTDIILYLVFSKSEIRIGGHWKE